VSYRILITGSRSSGDEIADVAWRQFVHNKLVATVLDGEIRGHITVVHGECVYGGVDLWAAEWAAKWGPLATDEPHPARLFPSPPDRNSHMVQLGADLCIAFPAKGSRGTWDCLRKAVDAGIDSKVCVLPRVNGRAT
jgi:hypothetical protein